MTSAEQNQLLFLKWLATNHSALYNAYVASGSVNAELSGFFDAIGSAIGSVGTFVTGVLNQAPQVLQAYVANRQQADMIKVNLERARAGQFPINPDGSPVQPAQVTSTLPTTSTGAPAPVSSDVGGIPVWMLVALGVAALAMLRR